ncbi:MFS general substrate transporter [Wolfiporia cocos MD-104 SS10]|uniref:MFS general substrate transporter n=1 Tax=Wolfiporia cocos (strain MD-104) TaxID=742152 RepID=A0A2H3J6J5_WOLCO|nr:MFS general substrate transporter [Wolfiporia cocos MD-104 SS10]
MSSTQGGVRSSSRRPASRQRGSRNPSLASLARVPEGPAALINPEGQLSNETAELLHEFVHPHRHESEDTLIQEEVEEVAEEGTPEFDGSSDGDNEEAAAAWRESLPWWRRPSPIWFLSLIPLTAIAMSATIAPKVEIFTRLVCDVYKPEYTVGRDDLPNKDLLDLTRMAFNGKTYELCASDPVVQKAVAKLSLIMIATMGCLSCLTAAWWGSLSDRYGRTRVLGIAAFGLLATDFTFIITAKFSDVLPGGYWFLVIGPIVDGLFGGLTTVLAAIQAYLADCTSLAARARTFSLFFGLLFTGMSIGPTLASLFISATGNVLAIFYVAAAMHIVYTVLVWFVIPESLSPSQIARAKKLHSAEISQRKDAQARGGWRVSAKRVFGFLMPLALLVPIVNDGALKKKRRDWSLLLLATGSGCVSMLIGAMTSKMQYMTVTFGWSSEQIGYWSSIVGASRAFHLTVFLPIIIKLLQPKPPAIRLPVEPDEPLQPVPGSSAVPLRATSPAKARSHSPASSHHAQHSPTFDLLIARCSLGLEVVAYTLMAFAPSGTAFTAYSVMGAFGAGFGPAMSSIASVLYMRNGGKELGKLYGALGVVQAICSQILGPLIYGMTLIRTVATFPKAIFFVSVGTLVLSLLLLSFIRLSPPVAPDAEEQGSHVGREETLVDVPEPLIIIEDADEQEARRKKADAKAAAVDVIEVSTP